MKCFKYKVIKDNKLLQLLQFYYKIIYGGMIMKDEKLKKLIKDLDLTDLFNEDELTPLEEPKLKPIEVKLKPFDVTLAPLEEPKLKPIENIEEK